MAYSNSLIMNKLNSLHTPSPSPSVDTIAIAAKPNICFRTIHVTCAMLRHKTRPIDRNTLATIPPSTTLQGACPYMMRYAS